MRWLAMITIFAAVGCSTRMAVAADPEKPSPKIYQVVHLARPNVRLDGIINEPAWKDAHLESKFCFPWREEEAPLTEFRALFDDKYLYFCFNVEDEDVVIDRKTPGEQAVVAEDRVELYFAPDLTLKKYYSVEMDHLGRKLDYMSSFHRNFDFTWELPEIKFAGKRTPKGYTVEGRIPLKTLAALGLPDLDSGKLRVGIYRAQFSHGDGPAPVENWISWVDPHTVEEDFHIPQTLGVFQAKRDGKR